MAQVYELYHSEQAYQQFIQIPPFQENAADIICDTLRQLEQALIQLAE